MRFWVVLLVTLHLIAAIIVFAEVAGDNAAVQREADWLTSAVTEIYAVLTIATVLFWLGSFARRVVLRGQQHHTGMQPSDAAANARIE